MAANKTKKLDLVGQAFGNYVVDKKLGEGGMGAVFLAIHPHIGKKVALKVLHSNYSDNEEVIFRFFTEAKAVNNIGHSNIVDISDHGVLDHPEHGRLYYFIMEYLEGLTLKQVIRREGKLPVPRALAIATQTADALAASHRAMVFHRDLKPDNVILVNRNGRADFVKLLDFGIAKLAGDGSSSQTRTGMVLGTPAYMSPEQCEGKGRIDQRTDIYSLGIVLYEMLTGRVPFSASNYGDVLIQHLTRAPEPPTLHNPQLPASVEAVVMKALEKRPDNRYPNMQEFAAALSDPSGYVQKFGGAGQFAHTPIPGISSPARPLPAATMMADANAIQSAPPPMPYLSDIPVSDPTTLRSGVGMVPPEHGRSSKSGWILGAGIAIVAAAATVWFVKREPQKTDSEQAQAQAQIDRATIEPAVKVLPDAPPATPVDAKTVVDAAAVVPVVDVKPATIFLTVSGTKDADVFLDGKKLGVVPGKFEIPRSETAVGKLVISKKGFQSIEFEGIELQGDAFIPAKLQKASSGTPTKVVKPHGTKPFQKKKCDPDLFQPDCE